MTMTQDIRDLLHDAADMYGESKTDIKGTLSNATVSDCE